MCLSSLCLRLQARLDNICTCTWISNLDTLIGISRLIAHLPEL